MLVYLYGPPAVGKLTVAQRLAELTGFRLFHNHLTVNAIRSVFDYGTSAFGVAIHRLRLDVFGDAAANGIDVIFTNNSEWGGAEGRRQLVAFTDRVTERVEENGGGVVFVQLTAPDDVLLARVSGESRRAHAKLLDPGRLGEMLAVHDRAPLHEDDLVVDTSASTPDEAAAAIATRLGCAPPLADRHAPDRATGRGPDADQVRYDVGMESPFVESLRANFDEALRLLDAAVADCPDELWAVDLWPDQAPTTAVDGGGLVGSAPWFLAYHALTVLDYDLGAELEPWAPPTPFDDNTWSLPNRAFTRDETLGYVEHCRERVAHSLAGLSDEKAATPVPPQHRYGGQRYGVLIASLPLHTVEHATQIRQHLTASGVHVTPMPGDRHYQG